jgi:iron complex outermembrane receptor protein
LGPEPPTVRDRDFTGASGSAGVRFALTGNSAFVANFSAAARAPALEELYNFGPHVGNLAFEIGNPELDLERTMGVDLSLRSRTAHAGGELNFFHYEIDNFVFLDFTGDIVDNLREAEYLQGDSRFTGFEGSGHLDVHEHLHLNAALSVVRARLTDTGENLPRIPPLSGRVQLEIPWKGLTIGPEVAFAARQGRVFRDESPTAGSAVFNIDGAHILVREHTTHTIAVKGYNLTNETYRLHTSFIKDLAPEMGRGVRVTYSVRFF